MEIGGKPNFPEVAATFNAATNHPLKLAMLGWMALQPEKPQSAAGILEDLNSNQGTYPGYAPPMAKAGQMHEYCTIAFTGAELIEPAGKLPSRSGRDSPAYTVPQESAGGTLAALGACMDWELAYPDETLSHFLGARSSGRGTLTKSGAVTRLAVYDTLLSSGAATSEVLRARTGRDEKAMNGLLRNLRDAGLVSMVRDSYSFDLRHISILGYPSDHAPLHPKEHFELKALYTLLTELYVRKQYQMTGGVLLKALKARHPDIDGKQTAYLLRRRIENNGAWRKFVLLETTTQTPDLHRKQYAAADEAREPMQDLVNRYKEVSEPENWEKWQKRAREILTTPELLAELMEKAGEADGQRRSVRLDDTLAMQITAILGRGGMPYAELYKRLSERRKEMPSRSALRTFIRRHNQLTATMRRSTGAPGVNQEMFVSLPGEPVPPHAVQSAAAQPHTERTSWRDDARCRDTDPDYFFEERADAQRFCAGCSVNGPCFQFAAASGQEFGIWGLNKNRRDIFLSKLPDWVLGELYPDTISNKQLLRATTSG